ncbi:MAG: RNA-binding protein [Candidatus Poribacteria bacterium]|nr:MAG: RNA-binding protein [Candidatus Poribacteria bacterium]
MQKSRLTAGLLWVLIGSAVAAAEIRFSDVTQEAGIHFVHVAGMTGRKHLTETMGSGAAFLDYDNDGDLDLYIVQSGYLPDERPPDNPGSVLYRNNGDGTFTDVTALAGCSNNDRYGMGVAVGDYNNDGFDDLYVTNYGPNRLYRNNGDGTFTDVTEEAGVGDPRWGTSAAFLDYDRDGDLDLFVANYLEVPLDAAPCRNVQNPDLLEYCHPRVFPGQGDVLYRNNGDGTFTDVSEAAGVVNPLEGKGLGVAIGDYNNDGWPDIYVGNDTTRNFLYENRKDGTFEDVALLAGCGYNGEGKAEGSMGIDFGDYNRDGWLDLFMTHSTSETNTLYQNLEGLAFADVTDLAGLGYPSYPMTAFGTLFVDLDNDGWLDLFVVNGHVQDVIELLTDTTTYRQPDQIFRNSGDGTFTDVSLKAGAYFSERYVGRGAAFGDYDNDGDMDVFIVNSNDRAVLLRNDTEPRGNWLRIQVRGRTSNRNGYGTRVAVTAQGTTQIAEVRSGSSYCSANDQRLLFGLGSAEQADRVEVRWPSGEATVLEKVPVNRTLSLLEPGSP